MGVDGRGQLALSICDALSGSTCDSLMSVCIAGMLEDRLTQRSGKTCASCKFVSGHIRVAIS